MSIEELDPTACTVTCEWFQHAVGSSRQKTSKSWLSLWDDYFPGGKKCQVRGCPSTYNLIGGHVVLKHQRDKTKRCYIVPICRNCNNNRSANENSEDDEIFYAKSKAKFLKINK
ncbi:hypothetical protein HK099_000609, partial [Clydaea vesicula]